MGDIQDARAEGFSGTTAMGVSLNYNASQVRQAVLFVEVPAAQAQTVLESAFQAAIADYEGFYNTLIEVVPVQDW